MNLRIANGQGFWGDWIEAPKMQVRSGPIDYLTMDYLAEITMSIMARQKFADPERGYARDFVHLMDEIMAECLEKNIRVITNAGGLNPESCRDALAEIAEEQGLSVNIGIVTGDDINGRLDELMERGANFDNYDTGESFETMKDSVLTANVYFGSPPIVEALDEGADIVVTGRCTDSSIVIAPCVHEFGWDFEADHDRLASALLAGHLLECGGQATGGNYQGKWQEVEGLENLGYPIVEFEENGDFVVTKHDSLGGRVERGSVMQQLLYEMDDPAHYIVPEVVMDLTETTVEDAGDNRVEVRGVRGRPPTDQYKVSMSYLDGFQLEGNFVLAWPDALGKARRIEELMRHRIDEMGLEYDRLNFEYLGVDGVHGPATPDPPEDPPEVVLRLAIRGPSEDDLKALGREFSPMIFRGPACANILGPGRPKPRPIPQYWPALIDKDLVEPRSSVQEVNP